MTSQHASATDIEAHNPFMGNHLGFDGLPTVVGATIGARAVAVGFSDGATRPFHHQWLRHSCYCPECGNPADGIRFFTVNSFDSDISPADVEVADGNLMVRWPDGHESLYGHDWLVHHAYDDEGRARRHSLRPQTWKADLADRFPTVSFSDASDGSAGQLRLYELLRDFGIVRVSNLGTSPDQTEPLANLVGPIHQTTVYGHIYDVRAEPVARLGAKTGMAQAPHIDDAFYYSQPGIDVFHCLVNTDEGGLSTYVDGFAIAESIKADDPDAYLALTTLPVDHIRRHPDEIDLRSRGPLVSVDKNGLPCGIRYFDRALAPLDVAPDDVDRLYDGIRAFSRRMVSDEFTAAVRVAAGDGMLIDNHRVLHGRTAFDPTQGRHLRLCHVPRDEFHGRLRELSRKHSPSSHDLQLPTGSGSLSAG